MLTHWDPFSEISRLQDQFLGRNGPSREVNFRPSVDIYEDDKGIHIKADIAGVDPDDIHISVDNNVLTISGERKLEKTEDDKEKGYHRVERFHGTFSRSFALTDDFDAEDIDANYDKGVLKLTLKKKPAKKPKQIKIKAS